MDLLVLLRENSAAAVAGLCGRHNDRLGRDIQIVRLADGERSPVLMLDVLADGRVLVDRDDSWRRLVAGEGRWRRVAAQRAPTPAASPPATPPGALKAKIRDRVSDVRRHLVALRTAMAEFGEDFDLDSFQRAYDSGDPLLLNQ